MAQEKDKKRKNTKAVSWSVSEILLCPRRVFFEPMCSAKTKRGDKKCFFEVKEG